MSCFPPRRFQLFFEARSLAFELAPTLPLLRNLPDIGQEASELIEKGAVRRRIEQSPVVVLAVNFDKGLAELAQKRSGDRPVVYKRLGPAIGKLNAPENKGV